MTKTDEQMFGPEEPKTEAERMAGKLTDAGLDYDDALAWVREVASRGSAEATDSPTEESGLLSPKQAADRVARAFGSFSPWGSFKGSDGRGEA